MALWRMVSWRMVSCAAALRALTDGKMPVKCIPGRLAMARLRPDSFPGGNPWQVLRSMHPESGLGRENRQFVARFARHASEMSWLWQDMCAMHPKSPANRRRRIHHAKILPGRAPFRCTGPSNHARRADLAIRRRRTTLAPATPAPPTRPRSAKAQLGANRAVNAPAPRINGSTRHCSGERVRGAARRRSAGRWPPTPAAVRR